MQRIDLLIIKLNKTKNKNHPEGEKQAGRQAEDWGTVRHETLT